MVVIVVQVRVIFMLVGIFIVQVIKYKTPSTPKVHINAHNIQYIVLVRTSIYFVQKSRPFLPFSTLYTNTNIRRLVLVTLA